MFQILPIDSVPPAAVEQLLDTVFGHDRHERTAYRMRAGTAAITSLSFAAVAQADDALLGTIQAWPVRLMHCGASHPLIMVGPVAVAPEHQRVGIGRQLMTAFLNAAQAQGSPPMVMIGDPEYYGRFFGFSADRTGRWHVDGTVERRRLLARNAEALPLEGKIEPATD